MLIYVDKLANYLFSCPLPLCWTSCRATCPPTETSSTCKVSISNKNCCTKSLILFIKKMPSLYGCPISHPVKGNRKGVCVCHLYWDVCVLERERELVTSSKKINKCTFNKCKHKQKVLKTCRASFSTLEIQLTKFFLILVINAKCLSFASRSFSKFYPCKGRGFWKPSPAPSGRAEEMMLLLLDFTAFSLAIVP